MPFDSATVGAQSKPFVQEVDARWLMAYAAGIGDMSAQYLDTAAQRIVAHPIFPVCLEWPTILDLANVPGGESASLAERRRNVHASHDLHIVRPISAGEQLTTKATIIGINKIRPGTAQTIRMDTTDEQGELVCQTFQLMIIRDVEVIGKPRIEQTPPELPQCERTDILQQFDIPIASGAAHVYTECARIWNPVHTDREIALAAGLPDIILHGTATLALAISKISDELLNGETKAIKRIGGRFSAMVLMPCTLNLVIHERTESLISYSVLTNDDKPAINHGFVCIEK